MEEAFRELSVHITEVHFSMRNSRVSEAPGRRAKVATLSSKEFVINVNSSSRLIEKKQRRTAAFSSTSKLIYRILAWDYP